MIQGVQIPLEEIPKQYSKPQNQVQGNLLKETDKEIEKLLKMGVIEKSHQEKEQILSPIFLVPKPDGTHRVILNLKKFNENVSYEHFKMENLNSATEMMKKGCYMASVDLRHAYYSVSVAHEFRKYLKFEWKGQLYEYTCLPNGLACCPRFFTKLLKPIYACLRSQGFLSAAFVDDCYLQGCSVDDCQNNIDNTVNLFESLGFVVHDVKSVLVPTTKLRYLGFCLNSEEMIVTLPEERALKIKKACVGLRSKKRCTIRELAQVIGQLVAAFPAAQWGPLFYRKLECDKAAALKQNGGKFEALMVVSEEGQKELNWWIQNMMLQPLVVGVLCASQNQQVVDGQNRRRHCT